MIIIIISSLLCRAVHVCQTWVMLGRYRFRYPICFSMYKKIILCSLVCICFFSSVSIFSVSFLCLCSRLPLSLVLCASCCGFTSCFLTYLISTLCISSCVFLSVFAGLSVFPPELLAFILCASWHSWLVSLLWLWCFPLWTMVNQTFN